MKSRFAISLLAILCAKFSLASSAYSMSIALVEEPNLNLGDEKLNHQTSQGEIVSEFEVKPYLEYLNWSDDGTKIVTSGMFDQIQTVWDWKSKQSLARKEKTSPGGHAIAMVGDLIVSSPLNRNPGVGLSLWNYRTNITEDVFVPIDKPIHWLNDFQRSKASFRFAMLVFPDTVFIFDTSTWKIIKTLTGLNAKSIALSPDGNELGVSSYLSRDKYEENINIYDVNKSTRRLSFVAWPKSGQSTSIAWSPDGRTIAVGDTGATPYRNELTE